ETRQRDREECQASDGAVVPDDLLQPSLPDRRDHSLSDFPSLGRIMYGLPHADEREPAVVVAQLDLHVERLPDVAELSEVCRRGRGEPDEVVAKLAPRRR